MLHPGYRVWWRHIWPKRTQKCIYGDENVLSLKLFNHPSSINRLLHINLDTSDAPMRHLYITAPKYGGLYRTFYDIRKTQFLSIFLAIRVQKWKMSDMLWCKLSALSKHVKLYDKLWISLSEAPFSIEPTAQPLYFILIQRKLWHFCDKIKLSDSCRWKYEYTRGEKHLAFVCHVQNRYKYSIVTHKRTPLLNQTVLCSIDAYTCPNILCQISFQTV